MMWLRRAPLLALLVALTSAVSISHPAASDDIASSRETDMVPSTVGPPESPSADAGSVILPAKSNETNANDTSVGAYDSNRQERLFPVVRIVTFNNDPCVATDGLWGTCYSQNECNTHKGQASGTCAKGYGVCCVIKASCGAVITQNNTYWNSPGYPHKYSKPGMCEAVINPPAGTCQILLNFESFHLLGPIAGDCNNDTFVFVGGHSGTAIPVLCGHNGGQHYYVDVENSRGPYKMISTISAIGYSRHWNVKVTFVERDDPLKAPHRCLQYFRSTSGSLSSFNYGGNDRQMLNNMNYAVCFACVPNYCDVGLSFNLFDLGNVNGNCGYDYIAAGPHKYCGDFPTLVMQLNATGPLVLWVGSDSNNDNLESGFAGTYMMMAC